MKKNNIILTVIPARGGSKSLPKKNIRLLGGKPLLCHSIDYSKASELVWKTVVSTDSPEIAEIAKRGGAEVPFLRPTELAEDLTQDFPVFDHALREVEKIFNTRVDLVVLLRPTSPLRPKGLIERAVAIMDAHPECTSIRSVASASQHPYRSWVPSGDYIRGYEQGVPEPYNLPRQLLPTVYYQTGDIEVIRRDTILSGSISGEKVMPLILSPEEMVDIDTVEDFQAAEKKIVSE